MFQVSRVDLNLNLFRMICLIRKAEETILRYYPEDSMKTPMHMSMGEEAIVAGVVHALRSDDQVFGTYRSHALYLAKTGETDRFFAEMYGKETGMARGKAGSMHLSAMENGLLCCSAIVASSIPIAMGAAFANKYLGNGKMVAVFFGDGATDEGVFWETINFCCLEKLPILFICEDNGFAVHTPRNCRQGFPSIEKLVAGFDCNVFEEESTDPEIIYTTTRNALAAMEKDGRPGFLRFHYYRYLEHVGVDKDFDAGYRTEQEFLKWLEIDPLHLQKEKLKTFDIPAYEIPGIEKAIDEQIARSIEYAQQSDFAGPEELSRGVFKCE